MSKTLLYQFWKQLPETFNQKQSCWQLDNFQTECSNNFCNSTSNQISVYESLQITWQMEYSQPWSQLALIQVAKLVVLMLVLTRCLPNNLCNADLKPVPFLWAQSLDLDWISSSWNQCKQCTDTSHVSELAQLILEVDCSRHVTVTWQLDTAACWINNMRLIDGPIISELDTNRSQNQNSEPRLQSSDLVKHFLYWAQ